jgi:hypothetical protein
VGRREEYFVNTSRLFFSGWLWGGLLVSGCAYISPALGGQFVPLESSVGFTPYPSMPTSVPFLSSSGDVSIAQVAQATSAVPASIPNFWASQSLARLMNQHDCPPQSSDTEPLSIDGGLRQVNRYKIAAQLFSCLEYWDRQAFDRQEQSTLQALRAEFKLELVALQGYSASTPMLMSVSVPPDSIGSYLSAPNSNVAANASANTAEYRQSISITSQGRVAMGVHYTDRALGASRNFLGLNAEASLGKIGLFGRYSAALETQSSQTDRISNDLLGDRSIQSWTAGIGIRDLAIQRSVLTVSVSKSIQPSNFTQSAQIDYGAFYQFPLTERLTLSPSIVIMTHSEKAGAATDVQGALQASFSF